MKATVEQLVEEVTGICNCIDAYKDRGRADPQCCPCNCGESIKAAIERAVREEREACARIAERYEPSEKARGVTYASRDIRARKEAA